jgi:diaminopimelate decarboxylase
MRLVAGCRPDEIADEAGTPVLVVSEDALRARAAEYADGLAERWPRSRVAFASSSFPCTAVQRVVVEEGLGLDVAGGGEIVTVLRVGADPRADRAAWQRQGRRGDRGRGRTWAGAFVVVDGADDLDRLEATLATDEPRGRRPRRYRPPAPTASP